MALLKTISTNIGIDATYWKIIDLNINWLRKICHVVLGGWSSKNIRDLEKNPIDNRNFDFNDSNFPFIEDEPQNERQIIYDKIKTQKVLETDYDGDQNDIIEVDGEFVGSVDA